MGARLAQPSAAVAHASEQPPVAVEPPAAAVFAGGKSPAAIVRAGKQPPAAGKPPMAVAGLPATVMHAGGWPPAASKPPAAIAGCFEVDAVWCSC